MNEGFLHKQQERTDSIKSKFISPENLRELCSGDEVLESLLEDVFSYSQRYVQDVWEMDALNARLKTGEISREVWKEEMDKEDLARTQLHNALIDSIGILSRNMGKRDIDNSWVKDFLGSDGKLARTSCGAYAFVVLFELLESAHEGK